MFAQKERGGIQKAVMDLIKAEHLDHVTPDIWKKALPKIKELLLAE